MSSPSMLFDAGLPVRIHKKGSRYYAALDGSALFGTGDSWEQAVGNLDLRYCDLTAFTADTGLPIETMIGPSRTERGHWRRSLAVAAIVVVSFGILMLPFSYAVSTAVERSVGKLNLQGGAEFWGGIVKGLVNAAAPKNDISPETKTKTLAALRVMVGRAQPYMNEIRPLFGCAIVAADK